MKRLEEVKGKLLFVYYMGASFIPQENEVKLI